MGNTVKDAYIGISDALISSLVGFSIVFAVLFVLIAFIKLLSLAVSAASKKNNKASETKEKITDAASEQARGSCGSVKLFGVPEKTAAMLMAIVADKTGLPLNQLRFISIREIKDGENDKK